MLRYYGQRSIPTIKWYSANAEFTNAFRHHSIGRSAIEALLKEVFKLPFVMAGDSKVVGQKMMLLSNDLILVITTIEREGQQLSDGRSLDVRHTTHHRIFKKEKEALIPAHLISGARDTRSSKH